MAYLANEVYDYGLEVLTGSANRLDITSGSTNAWANVLTQTTGSSPVTAGSPWAGNPDGRWVQVPAIANGNVTADGDAAFWAISALNAGSTLLASGSITGSQVVTSGNIFTLTTFYIRIPGPV